MESYNNIRLDQVPLNKKIKGRRNNALSIHDRSGVRELHQCYCTPCNK